MMDAWCELAAVGREHDRAAAQARGPAHVRQAWRDLYLGAQTLQTLDIVHAWWQRSGAMTIDQARAHHMRG